nr:MAG TPA: hypothetical protein [Caudoviricetes sp.]
MWSLFIFIKSAKQNFFEKFFGNDGVFSEKKNRI